MKNCKKIVSLFTVLCMVSAMFIGFAVNIEAATNVYYSYEVHNGEITINGCYSELSGVVRIPSVIDGYPVTTIGARAFRWEDEITSVIIPNSVRNIEGWAFIQCNNLTSVTIPSSVSNIEGNVFFGCDSLTDISVDENNLYFCDMDGVLFDKNKTMLISYPIGKTNTRYVIPDSVTIISELVFFECLDLTEVVVPDSVAEIGYGAFCDNELINIFVDENNLYFCDMDGVLFDKNKTAIISHPAGRTNTEYIIPDSVTIIADSAFSGCYNLTEVKIPDSVTEIGMEAFYYCRGIRTINIPYGIEYIYDDTFSECYNLTEVIIPASVTYIGYCAFDECYRISDVFYGGSEEEWERIRINGGNDYLTRANIIYNYNKHRDGKRFETAFLAEADTEYEVCITEGGEYVYYEFTPDETRKYKIYSTGGCDTYGYLYNADKNQLICDDDGGFEYNFCMTYYLDEGCTYYIVARIYSSNEIGTFGLMIEEDAAVVPVITYDTVYAGIIERYEAKPYSDITISEQIPTRSGHIFIGWRIIGDGELYYSGDIIHVGAEDITFYAVWKEIAYTNTDVFNAGKQKVFVINLNNVSNDSVVILALYKDDKLTSIESRQCEGDTMYFVTGNEYTSAKVMVWSGFDTLTPVCEAEEL